MSQTINHDVFDSLTSEAVTAPRCLDGYQPLHDGPLVSVIMTAYNVEHLVKTSVMSILNQSYRNLELIVVDDCSIDGTLQVLRLMESADERMQVIAKTGMMGHTSARTSAYFRPMERVWVWYGNVRY